MASRNLHLMMTADAGPQMAAFRNIKLAMKETKDQLIDMQVAMETFRSFATSGFGGAIKTFTELQAIRTGHPLAFAAVAGVEAASALGESVSKATEEIKQQGEASAAAGMSIEQFGAIMYQTSSDAETVTRSVAKLRLSISEALSGNEAKQAAFQGLGLDPKKLGGEDSYKLILDLGDAYKSAGDSGQRLSSMNELMGRGYIKMLPILTKSRKEIEEGFERAAKSGQVNTEDQLRTIQVQEELSKRWSASWNHASNSIAKGWADFKSGINQAGLYLMGQSAASVKHEVEQEVDARREAEKFRSQDIENQKAKLKEIADKKKLADEAEVRRVKFVAEMRKRYDQEVADNAKNAASESEVFFNKMRDLKSELDAIRTPGTELTGKQREDIQKLMEKTKKDAADAAGGVGEYDRMRGKLDDLAKLQEAGALTADQYAIAVAKLSEQFRNLSNASVMPPSSILSGSQEAFNFEYKFSHQPSDDPAKVFQDGMKQLNDTQKKQLDNGKKILEQMKNIGKF